MKMDNRKAITKPIISAAIVLLIIYGIETPLVCLNVFPTYNMLLCADILLRIILGTVSMIILNKYAKCVESKHPVKKLFTNRIPAGTWIVLIPFIIYIIAPFFKLFTAYIFTTNIIVTVIIVIVQQFATGFFEEATHRGLMDERSHKV